MNKTLSMIGIGAVAVIAAGAGFIGGVITTAKAAFSGAMTVAALDLKEKESKDSDEAPTEETEA